MKNMILKQANLVSFNVGIKYVRVPLWKIASQTNCSPCKTINLYLSGELNLLGVLRLEIKE